MIFDHIHSRFWPLWPQTGNCQLWPFWQLHIETLDSEPRQGPVWQLHLLASLAIASLDQNGTTHWHLPLWPQLAIVIGAQSGCHMVIYGYLLLFYFLYKNEMIRWFPCDTWRHSGSFIVMEVWGCTAGFIFSFCPFYQNYLFWSNCFLGGSMWFLLFLAPLC